MNEKRKKIWREISDDVDRVDAIMKKHDHKDPDNCDVCFIFNQWQDGGFRIFKTGEMFKIEDMVRYTGSNPKFNKSKPFKVIGIYAHLREITCEQNKVFGWRFSIDDAVLISECDDDS